MTDVRELRNTLGSFATGVCVITAQPKNGKPFGMTVNSFAAVSLEPPLVLWSLQNNSECFKPFEDSTQYAVNVLTDAQEDLAMRYAKKGQHDLLEADFTIGESGCPILTESLSNFECDIDRRMDGGDHVILLGKVTHFAMKDAAANPLLFFGGGFKQIR